MPRSTGSLSTNWKAHRKCTTSSSSMSIRPILCKTVMKGPILQKTTQIWDLPLICVTALKAATVEWNNHATLANRTKNYLSMETISSFSTSNKMVGLGLVAVALSSRLALRCSIKMIITHSALAWHRGILNSYWTTSSSCTNRWVRTRMHHASLTSNHGQAIGMQVSQPMQDLITICNRKIPHLIQLPITRKLDTILAHFLLPIQVQALRSSTSSKAVANWNLTCSTSRSSPRQNKTSKAILISNTIVTPQLLVQSGVMLSTWGLIISLWRHWAAQAISYSSTNRDSTQLKTP